MSCYFRHMKDVLEEIGVDIAPENKKEIDRIIHELVEIEYKNCSPTWKGVKERIKGDEASRSRFVTRLKEIHDIERLISRFTIGRSFPRDFLALMHSIDASSDIKNSLSKESSNPVAETYSDIPDLKKLSERINKTIAHFF